MRSANWKWLLPAMGLMLLLLTVGAQAHARAAIAPAPPDGLADPASTDEARRNVSNPNDLPASAHLAPAAFASDAPLMWDPRWYPDKRNTQSVAWGDVDGDGDLDLVVGNKNQPNQLYRNAGGTLTLDATWTPEARDTRSVAWGDVDGDGDLDLVVGNRGYSNQLYHNEGGTLTLDTTWTPEARNTQSVAWGDVDGDGDLDLAVGNYEANQLYRNNGGTLTLDPGWTPDSCNTSSVAWGDMDGDGDLDLAVGNGSQPNQLYRNEGGTLTLDTTWTPDARYTTSVAWGDVDGDGDLDLAVGNGDRNFLTGDPQPNQLYRNEGGTLILDTAWTPQAHTTQSVAWGDGDGDGDLDLAVGNYGQWDPFCYCFFREPNQLYRNDGGTLTLDTVWTPEPNLTNSVAWGDVDGDGDLDLAAGNDGDANQLYRNAGGTLTFDTAWTPDARYTQSVAWGDVDGDGDLDLAVGNKSSPSQLYRNNGGTLTLDTAWTPDMRITRSVAWGDVDGDGDLDLVLGNYEANQLYRNEGGTLTLDTAWTPEAHDTRSVAWGDVDGDGDLDLAVGNYEANQLYRNEGGTLTLDTTWTPEARNTQSVAWGDVDGDGDLDLAVGNYGANQLYRNIGGTLTLNTTWMPEARNTFSVAWGDVDGDGDLDLAVGNASHPNQLYRNEGGTLTLDTTWTPETRTTFSVAWGDVDGDGDLDLAVGNWNQPNQLYRNNGGTLTLNTAWTPAPCSTSSVAWGDGDGDGDLDLAVGNGGADMPQPNQLYRNGKYGFSGLPNNAPFVQIAGFHTAALYTAARIQDSFIPFTYTLFDPEGDPVGKVDAFYSLDGGGKWLPAIAADATVSTHLASSAAVSTTQPLPLAHLTTSSTLNLDFPGQGAHTMEVGLSIRCTAGISNLAAALRSPWPAPTGTNVLLFENVGGGSPGLINVTFSDQARDSITSVTPFAIVSTTFSSLYTSTNVPKTIPSLAAPPENSITSSLTVTDGPSVITDVNVLHLSGTHTFVGDIEIALQSPAGTWVVLYDDFGCNGQNFNFGIDDSSVYTPTCPPIGGIYQPSGPGALSDFMGEDSRGVWTLRVTDRDARDHGGQLDTWGLELSGLANTAFLRPIYGRYRPAQALSALQGAPLTSPFTLVVTNTAVQTGTLDRWRLQMMGIDHVYTWDTFASGVLGQSDNVVFRLTAHPQSATAAITGTYTFANTTPGLFQRPFASATTFPFRVRGTQVRVVSNTSPVAGALVYHLPAGQSSGAAPIADNAGVPYQTDAQGYLQGRGQINIGDHLVALLPITATDSYTLYITSAAPTMTGLDAYTVAAGGVQTLTVSAFHPLILFNLDVSLEWDARADATFLSQLRFDLQRAAELLYNATNGQAALGDLTIYHAKAHWETAAIQIHASNALIPNADVGGIVTANTPRAITVNPYALPGQTLPYTLTYLPGSVRMGTVWSRYGEAGGVPGEDWPRALMHELGHYLFYLYDDYMGLNAAGALVPVSTCGGSLMSNPYVGNEYRTLDDWAADCTTTLAARRNGGADWDTLTTLYPALHAAAMDGPAALPLAVTQLHEVTAVAAPAPLPDFLFTLTDAYGASLQPGPQAQAILYQDDRLVDLGHPEINKVIARGARAGDRLCVYELAAQPPRWGCETLAPGDTSLALVTRADWQPEILLTPWSTATVVITVTNAPAGLTLVGRVYPTSGQATAPLTLTATGTGYTGTFNLPDPDTQAFVQVWVAEADTETAPRREAVTSYAIGGSAICKNDCPCSTPPCRNAASDCNASTENFRPAISPDGEVMLYTPLSTAEGFYTLQKATRLPDPLPWATVVGSGYYVLQSRLASPLTAAASIDFRYRRQDVPAGEEAFLTLYYWSGTEWVKLPTLRHPDYNEVTAPAQGPGLYVLMSSLEIPLPTAGWNLMSYPVQGTRPVTDALASIAGRYGLVYGYDSTDAADPWKMYAPSLNGTAMWVNDLHTLQFGQGYWISATQPITWALKGNTTATARMGGDEITPPATYYGSILATLGFSPTVGMTVVASAEGKVCAQTTARLVAGEIVYTLNVGYTPAGGMCGAPGQIVAFTVNGRAMAAAPAWQNHVPQEVTLTAASEVRYFYLPLVLNQ